MKPATMAAAVVLTAVLMVSIYMAASERNAVQPSSSTSALADQAGPCPQESMSASEFQTLALAVADAESFANAKILESALLTPGALYSYTGLAEVDGPECYWYAKMSGSKPLDWPPGLRETPTPGPSNTANTLFIAADSVSGYVSIMASRTGPDDGPSAFPTASAPTPTYEPWPTWDPG